MPSSLLENSIRTSLPLLLSLALVPDASLATDPRDSLGLSPDLIVEDDFDDPARTQELWNLDSADTWSTHLIADGSGGYALLFMDIDDNGGGQDGNPNSGASFPPPLQSGGGFSGFGGELPTFYDEAYFRFDMALDRSVLLERSPRVKIFGLDEPDLRVEMIFQSGTWSYRLVDSDVTATHWTPMPANATACHFEIEFVAGNSMQDGFFRVQVQATRSFGSLWTHTSEITATTAGFSEWSRLFLGLQTPADELFVPPIGSEQAIEWLYSFAYDNFAAYETKQAWLNNR